MPPPDPRQRAIQELLERSVSADPNAVAPAPTTGAERNAVMDLVAPDFRAMDQGFENAGVPTDLSTGAGIQETLRREQEAQELARQEMLRGRIAQQGDQAALPPGGLLQMGYEALTGESPVDPESDPARQSAATLRGAIPGTEGGSPGGGGEVYRPTDVEAGRSVTDPTRFDENEIVEEGRQRFQVRVGQSGLTVQSPDGEAPVPPQVQRDPRTFLNWLQRGRDADLQAGDQAMSLDPNNPVIPREMVESLWVQYQGLLDNQPQGQAGPFGEQQIAVEMTRGGAVPPHLQEQLGKAQEGAQLAQQRADQVARDQQLGQQQALQAVAQEQQRQALEREREQQAMQHEIQSRMRAMDETIQQVAESRVDPNQVFGGAGGRFGAMLSVALGELGRSLTGGDNTALRIINQAVERNIRAQETNLGQLRASASMQGQALSQMHNILQDQQAARDATRAIHYQALISQLESMMSGLSGKHLAAAQELRNELLQAQQAARAVAAAQASTSITQRFSAERRVSATAPEQAIQAQQAGAVAQSMAVEQQQQQRALQEAVGATEGGRALLTQLESALQGEDIDSAMTALDAIVALPDLPPEMADAAAEARAELAGGVVRSALARGDQQERGQRRGRQGSSGGGQRTRRPVTLQAGGEGPNLAEGLEELQTTARQGATGTTPYGTEEDPRQPRVWLEVSQNPEDARVARETAERARLWDQFTQDILRIRGANQAEMFSSRDAERVRDLARQLRDSYRTELTGAAAPEAEMDRILSSLPDPNDDPINFGQVWDRIENVWAAARETRARFYRNKLESLGLVPQDSGTGWEERVRAQDEARFRASDLGQDFERRGGGIQSGNQELMEQVSGR